MFERENFRQQNGTTQLDGAGSYKTYFRPLRQTPLPYPLTQGETITQSVSLIINDENVSETLPVDNETAQTVSVKFGGLIPGAAAFPRIGMGVPPTQAAAMAKAMRASAGNSEGDITSICTVKGL